jgi:threonine aldolase
LKDDLWLRTARHSNAMADRLAAGLAAIPGARLVQPVEANEVFAALPESVIARLREHGFSFYDWPSPEEDSAAVVRLVTSHDMRASDVDAFLEVAGTKA